MYYARLPKEHGEYLFVLKGGENVYGRYAIYPFPGGDYVAIKVANHLSNTFHYLGVEEIRGHYDPSRR
jgi:hypothetical protein